MYQCISNKKTAKAEKYDIIEKLAVVLYNVD
jgi:hypothetical protein